LTSKTSYQAWLHLVGAYDVVVIVAGVEHQPSKILKNKHNRDLM